MGNDVNLGLIDRLLILIFYPSPRLELDTALLRSWVRENPVFSTGSEVSRLRLRMSPLRALRGWNSLDHHGHVAKAKAAVASSHP